MHSTRPYGRVLCFLGYEAKGQTFASHTSRTSGLPYGVFTGKFAKNNLAQLQPVLFIVIAP
jgi:hypothetical protein